MSNGDGDIGIVLLAAGEASRFGSAKQLLPIAGIPMVRRAALAALQTGARVIIVTGAYCEQVEMCVGDLPITMVFNPKWPLGLGHSIACGIDGLRQMTLPTNAAIIGLVDQPMIGTTELLKLVAAHHRAPERIIASSYNQAQGPPCLFPRAYFDDLANLHGVIGAKALLQHHAAEVDVVLMPQGEIDIDRPEDHRRLIDIMQLRQEDLRLEADAGQPVRAWLPCSDWQHSGR